MARFSAQNVLDRKYIRNQNNLLHKLDEDSPNFLQSFTYMVSFFVKQKKLF